MTAPPAGALEACLALLEKATPGPMVAVDETQDIGRGMLMHYSVVRGADGENIVRLGYTDPNVHAFAAAVNLLRTHGPALLAALRLREGCEGLVDSLPSNWCDPMLTGPDAALGSGPWGCPDVESLIAAIKQRLRDDLARVLEESATGDEAGSA